MNVFVTDYGPVTAGIKFKRMLEDIAPGLQKSKRTKAYKMAAFQLRRLEIAAEVLAEVEWISGGVLEKTP